MNAATERTRVEWETEDDVKERIWTPTRSKIARQKEIQYLCDRNVYEFATGAEARAQTGRNPAPNGSIPTRAPLSSPRHRSRLVCTEVRHKGVEQVFSATPPLEALRVLISVARQEDVHQVADPQLISIADVSRAHVNADAVRNVNVRLPEEDSESKEAGICGKIAKDDVRNLGRCSTVETALCTGLRRRRILTYTVTIVQSLADRRDVNTHWIFCRRSTSGAKLSSWDQAHSQAVTFLGRTRTLRKRRIEYEPDTQNVLRSLKALGLTGARCVAIPGSDDVGGNTVSELSKLRRTAKWHEPQKNLKLKRRRIPLSVRN